MMGLCPAIISFGVSFLLDEYSNQVGFQFTKLAKFFSRFFCTFIVCMHYEANHCNVSSHIQLPNFTNKKTIQINRITPT